MLGVVGLVSLGAHGLLWGFREMVAEWQPYVSALFGWPVAAAVLFAFNLCSAPYRLEKEHREKLARSNDALRAQIVDVAATLEDAQSEIARLKEAAPKLVLEIKDMMVSDRDGQLWIVLTVQLSNKGAMPTATQDWIMEMVPPGGEKLTLDPGYALKPITFVTPGGLTMVVPPDEIIGRKASSPIAPGAILQGFALGVVRPQPGVDERMLGCKIQVSCHDVHGQRSIQAIDVYDAVLGEAKDRYSPFLNVDWQRWGA